MEAPRTFRYCVFRAVKLQCGKIWRWCFPKDLNQFFHHHLWLVIFMGLISYAILFLILKDVPVFRLRYIYSFKDSSVHRIIMYGPSMSQEKVYFFNITNSEDFLETGVTLNVTEVGPYVYRVRTERKNPERDDADQTISYDEIREYEFLSDESNGNLDDEITTWNGPLIIVAESLKKSNPSFRQEFLSSLNLTVESVIVKKKVRELIFGHYHDDMLVKASDAHLNVPFKDGNFSWLDKKEGGTFTVTTGISEGYPGTVKRWNGSDKLNFWNGDACNKVDGALGDVGPPYTYKNPHYSLFLPDLCRSLTLQRAERGEYQATKLTFANSTENPDNSCYETRGPRPSGVYSVSPCRSGAPLWISFPHFYLGDSLYAKNISGLKASENQHGSYFKVFEDFHRNVELKLSTQLNIEVGELSDIPQFSNVPKGIYPILWSTVDIKGSDRAWWLMSFVVLNALRDTFYRYPIYFVMILLSLTVIAYIISWIHQTILTSRRRSEVKRLKETLRDLRRKVDINKEFNEAGSKSKKSKLKGIELPASESIPLKMMN